MTHLWKLSTSFSWILRSFFVKWSNILKREKVTNGQPYIFHQERTIKLNAKADPFIVT